MEWDDEERAWMHALSEYEDSLCGGCGSPIEETTSVEYEDDWETPDPVRCFKCTELSRKQSDYRQVNDKTGKPLTPHAHALKFKVYRRRRHG